MATKSFSRIVRSQLARQLATPAALQQRTLAAAGRSLARAGAARPAVVAQQVRGMKTIDFAGSKEDVYGTNFFYWQCAIYLFLEFGLTCRKKSVATGPNRRSW
jgi:hypothetical protein